MLRWGGADRPHLEAPWELLGVCHLPPENDDMGTRCALKIRHLNPKPICRGLSKRPFKEFVFRALIWKQNRSPATGLRENLRRKDLPGGHNTGLEFSVCLEICVSCTRWKGIREKVEFQRVDGNLEL